MKILIIHIIGFSAFLFIIWKFWETVVNITFWWANFFITIINLIITILKKSYNKLVKLFIRAHRLFANAGYINRGIARIIRSFLMNWSIILHLNKHSSILGLIHVIQEIIRNISSYSLKYSGNYWSTFIMVTIYYSFIFTIFAYGYTY